jgi:hypothetical protein
MKPWARTPNAPLQASEYAEWFKAKVEKALNDPRSANVHNLAENPFSIRPTVGPRRRNRLLLLSALKRLMAVSLSCLCFFAQCGTAAAETEPTGSSETYLPALLARMSSNRDANRELSQQFTSDELWHNRNFGKNGQITEDDAAKYENVFVEGLPYQRKVEQNGKPLTGDAAAAEEKRYEQAVAERRRMSLEEKRRGLHWSLHSSLPMCCLTTLFENRIVRHETIEGRDTVVVESTPRADARPANRDEKTSLNWKETTWIDSEDAMPARIVVESLADQEHLAKGNSLQLDFDRVADAPASDGLPERAVWLLRHCISRFHLKMPWSGTSGTTEQTWSNFKKFRVDMRLLDDSVQTLPEEQGNQ